MTSLWAISLTQLAYWTASVKPSWSVWKFLLLVYFSSWDEGFLVLGCCPSLYVTLWILYVSHTFQGSARLFPFVCISQGFRLKDLWSKPFLPFTKGFLNGRLQWNLWRMASNRRHLRASSCFIWLTNIPKMFGYKFHGCNASNSYFGKYYTITVFGSNRRES